MIEHDSEGLEERRGLTLEAMLFQLLTERHRWSFERTEKLNTVYAIDAVTTRNDDLPFVRESLAIQLKFWNPFPEKKFREFERRSHPFQARSKVFLCCHPALEIDPQGAAVVDMALKEVLFGESYRFAKLCTVEIDPAFSCRIVVREGIDAMKAAEGVLPQSTGALGKTDRDCRGQYVRKIMDRRSGFITAGGDDFHFTVADLAVPSSQKHAVFDALRIGTELIFDVEHRGRIDPRTRELSAGRARNVRVVGPVL
jgi:hypothetical protein